MASLLGILVWCCALIIASSAIQVRGEETTYASLRNRDAGKGRPVREAKRPSCIISIPEDEAEGLTKLLNGFLNVFNARSETAVVDASLSAASAFVLDCNNGVSGLETSVWRILNRVWFASSCQYSEDEFDQALREVENEADKVLITLRNVDMVPFNGKIKTDYYHSTVTTVRTTLLQAVEKMKKAQNSGRCHSSAVKDLTADFEEALQEIKSQKETIAVLRGEMLEARAAIILRDKALKEALDAMRIQKDETESALRKTESQNEAMEGALEIMRSQKERADNAFAEVAAQRNSTATALDAIESQEEKLQELRYAVYNQTSKTDEAFSSMVSASRGVGKEIEELRMKNKAVEEKLALPETEMAEFKANMSQVVESQRKQVEELRSIFDVKCQTLKSAENVSAVESAGGLFTKEIEELRMQNLAVEKTFVTQGSEFAEFKANMSQVVTKQAEKDSKQDGLLEELNAKLFPTTAIQAYMSWGLRGLTGHPLNIENEHYKGEFLYLARNPTDRSANVWNDGAILAVGGDKLRESAFQWELYQAPSEGKSVFYLRNKLNKLKPIASKQDSYGRRNYIKIETIESPTIGKTSQLVIKMKETIDGWYYYPRSYQSSPLEGRTMHWDSSPTTTGVKWVLTFASETITSTAVPPREFNSTVAPLPEETSTVLPLPEETSTGLPLPEETSTVLPLPEETSTVAPLPEETSTADSPTEFCATSLEL